MGILDDAIREHLELKRSHGAGDSELKQLEDEAFGLPTRPGEPDFPERAGEGAPPPEPAAQAPATAEASAADAAPPTVEPEQTAMEHPVVEPQTEAETPAPPEREADRVESAEEVPAPAEIEAPAAAEPEPTAFYDRAEAEELDLGDLDLDLEEGLDEGLGGRQPSDEGEPPAAEVADVDTVEHAPPEPPPEPPPEGGVEPQPASEVVGGEDASEEGEDVLEETPEFLQDRPEDDELWFEQGKPKDFDF